jgi:hypothetical protein
MRAVLSVLCVLALAPDASAQVRSLADADLPPGVSEQLQTVIDDPSTVHFAASGFIAGSETIGSNVAAFDGLLTVAGRVEGDIVVVNGDLEFESGAWVMGNVTVVGGSLRGADLATIGGTITIYGEGFSLYRRGERLVSTSRRRWRDRSHGGYDDDGDRWGRSEFLVRIGENYNRVEGLPLQFGPDIWTGGRSPFHVQALAVWRTATGSPFDTREMGYVARAEQFLGSALRVGGSIRSTVQPIESWSLSDTEASLAAALFHEDFRDYYERTGWSAYLRLAPRRSPLDLTIEYRDEDHETAPVRDPWTLFDGEDVWREQPLAAEGNIRLLTGSTELDFTRGSDFHRRGWLLRSVVNHRLDGDLTVPTSASTAPLHFNRSFTSGLIDVRRYQRIGWDAVLGLRAVAGGSAKPEPLPPQFQHALGGAGSLPGYHAFRVDCGARSTLVRRTAGSDEDEFFFPSYGCDRFALIQAEYRGGFDFRLGGHYSPHERDWGWHVDSSINWIVFFDAARAWSYARSDAFDTGTLYDVGGGVILGGFGLYGAVPLNGADRKLSLFVRLGPRF